MKQKVECEDCQKYTWNETMNGREYFCIYDFDVIINSKGKKERLDHIGKPEFLNKNGDCTYFEKHNKIIKSTDQLSKKK